MKPLRLPRLYRRRKRHLLFLLSASVVAVLRFLSEPSTDKRDIRSKSVSRTNITINEQQWKPKLYESSADVVWSQRGVYVDKSQDAHHLENVVLVTAANYAYLDFYRNWACQAKRLGLKWVLVALDHSIYNAVTSEKMDEKNEAVILSDSADYFDLVKPARFRQIKFNILSCSKLRMVYKIVAHTGLDLVFSDPDNVFLKDPFAEGVSLGDSIRSGYYEYIYQPNHKNYPRPNWKRRDVPPHEGNTGFYFVSGSKKRQAIISLFRSALEQCRSNTEIDDQTSFWDAFRSVRDGTMLKQWLNNTDNIQDTIGMPFHNMSFCQNKVAASDHTLSYCPMNPFQHPTGYPISDKSEVATYHANFCVGRTPKLAKMREVGAWSWENERCTIPTHA